MSSSEPHVLSHALCQLLLFYRKESDWGESLILTCSRFLHIHFLENDKCLIRTWEDVSY